MDKQKIPRHIAIIMDGNRRWAKKRGLSAKDGHKAGYENFRRISEECRKLGVKILTVYAFSTENWKRSRFEVSYLMNLFYSNLKKEMEFFRKNKIKFNVIGQLERLPKRLRELVEKTEEETKNYKDHVINVAISYGGRVEIIDAIKKLMKEKINPGKLNEDTFSKYLYTAGQPDPDLVIRTSGEMRLSGFLPWQSVYSEIYFSPKLWPDFKENDLKEAIEEYQSRQRRHGK